MKKIVALLLTILLVCHLAVPALAATEEYELPDLGLSLSIPSDYIVLTRYMDENDPLFAQLGSSGAGVIQFFLEDHIYLDALSPNRDYEIVFSMEESPLNDFSAIGDTGLLLVASGVAEEYAQYGLTVSSYDIFHHSQLSFLRFHIWIEAENTHVIQYFTSYDGKFLYLKLFGGSTPIPEDTQQQMQDVVDSIYIDNFTPAAAPEPTPAFLYTDPNSGASFTVPENWSIAELTDEHSVLSVQFNFSEDPTAYIGYACNDVWGYLTPSEQAIATRAEIDEEANSCAAIAEAFEVPISAVSERSYNGNVFYFLEIPSTREISGTTFTITVTEAVRIENGWMHVFVFGGTSDHPNFGELEKLLQTVTFPVSAAADTDLASASPDANSAAVGTKIPVAALILILVSVGTLLVCLIFVFLKKRARKNSPETAPAPQAVTPPQGITFCRHCGNSLPEDSQFCTKCGAAVSNRIQQ